MRHGQGVDFNIIDTWCNNELLMALAHPLCNERLTMPSRVFIMDSTVAQILKMHRADENAAGFAKRMHLYDAHADNEFNSPAFSATHFSPNSKYDTILVPLHSEMKAHWSLLIYRREGGSHEASWRAYHYDSLAPRSKSAARSFVRRLATEMLTVDDRVSIVCTDAHTFHTEVDVPQQDDGWTCGYRVAAALRVFLYVARGDVHEFNALLTRAADRERYFSRNALARMVASSVEVISKWRYLIATSNACNNIINYERSALLNQVESEEKRRELNRALLQNEQNDKY